MMMMLVSHLTHLYTWHPPRVASSSVAKRHVSNELQSQLPGIQYVAQCLWNMTSTDYDGNNVILWRSSAIIMLSTFINL